MLLASSPAELLLSIAAAGPQISLDAVTKPLVSSLLNQSQCWLKLKAWEPAEQSCSAVLEIEPQSAKALYRRGLARIETHFYDEAKEDLKQACALEPKSKEIRDAFARAKHQHEILRYNWLHSTA